MPNYKLSAEAVSDVGAIGDHGVRAFGVTKALKYHLGLESRFELMSEFPRIGIPTYDLHPGLYRQPFKAHTIFYTIQPDHILIVRVLPGRADFARNF